MKTDKLAKTTLVESTLVGSTLVAKASEEVDKKIQEELNIPDPQVDKAMATLTGDIVWGPADENEDTDEKEEDEDGGN